MSDQVSGPDPYAAVLADLIRRRDEIDSAIRVIEAVRIGGASSPAIVLPEIKPDSDDGPGRYLGLSISEAAKKLLKSKRKTMNSADIAQGLIAGGMPFTSSDPSNTVGSVLSRRAGQTGDIVKVSRGQWGLSEWYPHTNFRRKETGKEAPPPPPPPPATVSGDSSDSYEAI